MNATMKVGCMLVASVALFSLSGCNRASASIKQEAPARTVVAAADAHATADAEADNGPGCAESAQK